MNQPHSCDILAGPMDFSPHPDTPPRAGTREQPEPENSPGRRTIESVDVTEAALQWPAGQENRFRIERAIYGLPMSNEQWEGGGGFEMIVICFALELRVWK